MKNIFISLFLIYTICSCSSKGSNSKEICHKPCMENWAWKIFIFTDEGKVKSYDNKINNFNRSLKGNPIFVDNVWGIYNSDDLFLDTQNAKFKNPIVNVKFSEFIEKK